MPESEIIEEGAKKTEIELLIDRIHKIQEELPEHSENALSDEEQAFLDAAEEQYASLRSNKKK